VEVEATITVDSIQTNNTNIYQQQQHESYPFDSSKGYEVILSTQVSRVSDGASIAEGSHTIWIADHGF